MRLQNSLTPLQARAPATFVARAPTSIPCQPQQARLTQATEKRRGQGLAGRPSKSFLFQLPVMIDLGLARISRLLQYTPQTWKTVHVAGTNGKGSICAYLSAMLHASGASCGRFNSPHLIDRWDCITVNEKAVSEAAFLDAEALVKQRDRDAQVGATPFELLAATAFEIFHREKVEYGVIETGLGGKLDATNALSQKSVTVISKIGLDHQGFLGDSLEEIALHKAGIMRPDVPCVVDDSNQPSVLQAIQAHAKEVGARVVYPDSLPDELSRYDLEPHQLQNLACAYTAFKLTEAGRGTPLARILPAIKHVRWPGRLQLVNLEKITGHPGQQVLLDGAHNVQSAEVLAAYVNKHLRPWQGKVTWVLAASDGKDLTGMLDCILRPEDQVFAVRFGPVDGMPWVKAADPQAILDVASAKGVKTASLYTGTGDLESALRLASSTAGSSGPVVIAGSLYLVSEVLRLLRSVEQGEPEP